MTSTAGLPDALHTEIVACGYFPAFVADTTALAVGEEPVLGHLVHHEATFNNEEIGRHLSVLVLTPTRLLVSHTDDEAMPGEPVSAITTTESVPLRAINSVSLSQVVVNPDEYGTAGAPVQETWLNVSWGLLRQVDVEPAGCADPDCDADHGYVGSTACEDLNLRMSAAADGGDKVRELILFGSALQQAVGAAR